MTVIKVDFKHRMVVPQLPTYDELNRECPIDDQPIDRMERIKQTLQRIDQIVKELTGK